ncbi:MAG TPA: Dabb family protein [Pyrinomonadaceae bacterium]|nr:Dabb family protein [Pyrinomonadaceae bacterium]
MLTHVVIWRYRPEVDQGSRDEHLAELRSLAGLVEGMERFAVGFDILHLARSYDTALVALFRDRAALDEYTIHPQHLRVADLGRGLSETIASVDFED